MNPYSFKNNKINECYTQNEFYSLYKIVGFGSKNNFSITKNELNGLIAWISGPYVIFYDILSDSQVFFLKNINNKIISCIQFSLNGKFFATGEGNCKNGDICLYDIFYDGKKKDYNLLLSYQAHKYGIDKLLFFKNDKYLLSIGNKEDKLMNIMDIENKQIVYTYIFNKNILGVDICNDFAVMCGDKFVKLYEFNLNKLNTSYNYNSLSNDLLIKKPIDLSKLKDKSFVYASIYINNKKNEKKVFFITEDCYLVELKTNSLILTRWINLKGNRGYNLTIWDNKIGCGCSDGIYRIFNIDNLGHIQTLHKPPPLGPQSDNFLESGQNNTNLIYPDVMCNLYSRYHKKLITVYSNKYFIVWDIKNMNQMNIVRYHIFQSGSIKNMDFIYDDEENILKIATCSDDKTVIYWNLRLNENNINPLSESKIQHITYSKYIKHIFYFSKNYQQFKLKNENDDIKNNNYLNEGEDTINLASIKFSVDNHYLYIGDSIGNLHIFSLTDGFEEIIEIPAHNGSINSIDTISINYDGNLKTYIASGSSDNYVNIFDISKGIKKNLNINDFNTIFEKMSSEIINLVFCVDKNKIIKLIVAELSSAISFFQLINNSLQILQKYNEESLKTYCLCYSPSIKKIISGHNGKIIIWKTSSNIIHKHFQVSKGDKLLDNFRIGADSNGVMFATSNNDKNIRIRALHDGKLLCKISVAESISYLSFALNDNYLIATSVEGYIYFYKINQNFISKLKKDKELINSMEEKTVINNKLNLLQKLLENDISLSKNEQVNNLIEKFRKSEETSIEDLKKLDEFLIESKRRGFNTDEKQEEIIQLKEDKPNNNDDQDNQNNNDNKENKEILSKSNLFEINLKENKAIDSQNKSNKILCQNRVSIIDKYIKKENKKNDSNKLKKINIGNLDLNNLSNSNNFRNAKSPREINYFKKEKEKSSPKKIIISPRTNPFGKNIIKTDYKNNKYQSKETKENNISSDNCDYNLKLQRKNKIFNLKNSKNNNINRPIDLNNNYKDTHKKYNSFSFENKDKFIVSKEVRFFINRNYTKKKTGNLFIKKENNFKILNNKFNNFNSKQKLIQEINNINIEQIKNKKDLVLLESNLELLRNKIRRKLGIFINDTKKEKLLEQFGVLLIDKINQLQKNK